MGPQVSRNTVKKALVVVVCLAAAIIVTKLYLKTIAVLIFLAILVYVLLSLKIKKEKNAPSGAAGKSDKLPISKSVQFLQYVIYVLTVVAIIKWFIGQLK